MNFFSRALIEVFQKEEFSLSTTSSYLQLNISMPLSLLKSHLYLDKRIYIQASIGAWFGGEIGKLAPTSLSLVTDKMTDVRLGLAPK